jgi:hypothetical protein
MAYNQYLRLAGTCSIVFGLALTALALPGVFLHYSAWWAGLLFVPATLLVLGGLASRRGIPLGEVGRWLTDRPLRAARPGRRVMPAPALRRQLLGETATRLVVCAAWIVLIGWGGVLLFGAGLAAVAYGAVQLFGSGPRVESEERRRQVRFRIHRRPLLGAPDLTA